MATPLPDAAPRADPLLAFQTDERLAPFLRPDFDGIAYASDVLAKGAFEETNADLSRGIAALDAALKDEVYAHYDELMGSLEGIAETEKVLDVVRGGVHALRDAVARVRGEIADPHDIVTKKTTTLENATSAADVLHRAARALKLVNRLKACVTWKVSGATRTVATTEGSEPSEKDAPVNAGDLAKAAKLLSDAEDVIGRARSAGGGGDGSDPAGTTSAGPETPRGGGSGSASTTAATEVSLVGLDVLDRDAGWLREVRADVRARAAAALRRGVDATSQAEVGAALQVMYNLDELKEATDAEVSLLVMRAVDAVKDALDPRALARKMGGGGGDRRGGRGVHPPAGHEHRWTEAFWQRLADAFLERAHECGMAAWHVQRVVAKKRDPMTHALFLDEIGAPTPCEAFVAAFAKGAGEAIQRSFATVGFAKDALLSGYPRLMDLLDALHDGLLKETDHRTGGGGGGGGSTGSTISGVPPATRRDGSDRETFARAGDAVAAAYVARVFQRLSEPVNALLSPSTLQSLHGIVRGDFAGAGATAGTSRASEDVRRFMLRIRQEIDAVGGGARPALLDKVVQCVGKALKLMATKAELAVVAAADARSFSSDAPATASQKTNAAIASTLEDVHDALAGLVPMLPTAASQRALSDALEEVARCAIEATAPVMRAATARCEDAIARLHDEDWAGGAPPGEACSTYMRELCDLLAHLRREHLKGGLGTAKGKSVGCAAAVGGANPCGDPDRRPSPSTVSATALATRCLDFFLRHASLVRAIGENGKLRLTKDLAELEHAVSAHLCPAEAAGASYKALRAFKPLLFSTPTRAVENVEIVENVPPAPLLLHLYSHAPRMLQAPYERAGLAPAQYSVWMDAHCDGDVWAGVKGTLDAYESRSRGGGGDAEEVIRAMRVVGAAIERGGRRR